MNRKQVIKTSNLIEKRKRKREKESFILKKIQKKQNFAKKLQGSMKYYKKKT